MSDASDHFHDAEKLARKHRAEGLREAAEIAKQFPCTYDDGVSLHAENMTAARIANNIRARADAIERGED